MKIRILIIKESFPDGKTASLYGISPDLVDEKNHTALCLIEKYPEYLRQELIYLADQNVDVFKILELKRSRILLLIHYNQFSRLIQSKILERHLRIKDAFFEIERRIKNSLDSPFSSNNSFGLDLTKLSIMGVLNVTPDSFSDGGKFLHIEKAVAHALTMEREGADIIDIGGESSRPGSDPVSEEEELARVLPVIEAIRKNSDILISIDTCKSSVAEKALSSGANWINDISGLQSDPEMIEVAKKRNCPVVIMHMKGTPKTMQINPTYDNVCLEVNDYFEERIATLNQNGVKKIILDPGIGFGKRLEDNLALLQCCGMFKQHGLPLLIGSSRKSFIGLITDQPVEKRLAGTLASLMMPIQDGVNILRVHDVHEIKDFLKVMLRIDTLGSSH